MANTDDPRTYHSRKSIPQPGISSAKETELSKKIHDAHSKALDNEKRIQELEKTVNDKNQWNNTLRGWIGSKIRVRFSHGPDIGGVLRAVDRYTLEVEGHPYGHADPYSTKVGGDKPITILIHKGAIATIWQE